MPTRQRLRDAVLAFAAERRGVSAIEFALVLPIMLALLFGISEFGRAYAFNRKVSLLARAVSDLTSQGDTTNPIAPATMADILTASRLVMTPFGSSSAQIVVSAMAVPLLAAVPLSLTQSPRVCSSYASSNATARSVGLAGDLTIPAGFQMLGMRYVLAEVTVPYTPLFGSSIMRFFVGGANNQFTFKTAVPWPVRGGQTYGTSTYNEVVLPNGLSCPPLL